MGNVQSNKLKKLHAEKNRVSQVLDNYMHNNYTTNIQSSTTNYNSSKNNSDLNPISTDNVVTKILERIKQTNEIPTIKLVPRTPAIKKGYIKEANFAGFKFDKQSITPLLDAINSSKCKNVIADNSMLLTDEEESTSDEESDSCHTDYSHHDSEHALLGCTAEDVQQLFAEIPDSPSENEDDNVLDGITMIDEKSENVQPQFLTCSGQNCASSNSLPSSPNIKQSSENNNSNGQKDFPNDNNNGSNKDCNNPNNHDKNSIQKSSKYCNVPSHQNLVQRVQALQSEIATMKMEIKDIPAMKTKIRNLTDCICELKNTRNHQIYDEKIDILNEEEKEIVLRETNCGAVNIEKKLNKVELPNRAQLKIQNPKLFMENFGKLHANQFMRVFDSIAIQNYNFRTPDGEPLYFLCTKQNDQTFRQTAVCTYNDDVFQKHCAKYNVHIKPEQLPKISVLSSNLVPDMAEMTKIENTLGYPSLRAKLISETEWTKIYVVSWQNGNKASSVCMEITKEEFIDKMYESTDCTSEDIGDIKEQCHGQSNIILIPIIEPNKDKIQYAWVVCFRIKSRTFHIGISLEHKINGMGIKVSAIFLNLWDAHRLVQFHHRSMQCKYCNIIDGFNYDINDLEIGTGKSHRINRIAQLLQNNNQLKEVNKGWKRFAHVNQRLMDRNQQLIGDTHRVIAEIQRRHYNSAI